MSKIDTNELRDQIASAQAVVEAKDAELVKLYKLVNMGKSRITELEIKLVDQEILIESLRSRIEERNSTEEIK